MDKETRDILLKILNIQSKSNESVIEILEREEETLKHIQDIYEKINQLQKDSTNFATIREVKALLKD